MIAVSGTLRTNLDPFGQHDDLKLWDALRRSYLVDDVKDTGGERTSVNRFTLDTIIEDEGANLSNGQVCPSPHLNRQTTEFTRSVRWCRLRGP